MVATPMGVAVIFCGKKGPPKSRILRFLIVYISDRFIRHAYQVPRRGSGQPDISAGHGIPYMFWQQYCRTRDAKILIFLVPSSGNL